MKKFKNHPANDAWRYLGTDEEYDYYVVNEASDGDSLTGVYGDNGGEYWSHPLYLSNGAKDAKKHPFDYVRKCYKLYKEQGGKYI